MINRRMALKTLAGVPLGAMALDGLAGEAAAHGVMPGGLRMPGAVGQLKPGPEIYQSIGVEPIINCRGTFTIIGGSVHRPEVGLAMEAASQYFVQMDELAIAVGERLGELTGAEFGMVSAGCAAGMKHVTAGCVTGGNPEKLIRIPNLEGFEKTDVVMPDYSRNNYDHAIRNVGVRIISASTPEEFEAALGPRAALVYFGTFAAGYDSGPLSMDNLAPIARSRNVPILVDAAAEDLTIPNVHLARGADIVAYSGGKVICGPQCAGLLLGRRDLLMSAWQASSPHHGPGRDNKVGREETLGMLAAVEAWVTRNHAAEWREFHSWLELIARRLGSIDGVTTEVTERAGLNNRSPRLTVSWDPDRLNITGAELAEEVGRIPPRIAIGGTDVTDGRTSISIVAFQMQRGNARIVADRLHGVLTQRRPPRKTTMAAPGADVTGRWNAKIQYFSSESEHAIYIEEQDGNWLQGSHQGDFAVRDMIGTIEGNEVKLQSVYRIPGNSITYTFSGTVTGDTMAGEIHMGEYLQARFTATRHDYPDSRVPIVVPRGQPLAT